MQRGHDYHVLTPQATLCSLSVMQTIPDIINLWPTVSAFAADVGISYSLAKMWRKRASIPATRWLDVVRAAESRRLPVTLDLLAQAAATREKAA